MDTDKTGCFEKKLLIKSFFIRVYLCPSVDEICFRFSARWICLAGIAGDIRVRPLLNRFPTY